MKRFSVVLLLLLVGSVAWVFASGTDESTTDTAVSRIDMIDWNSPQSWPDRLLADYYVLPEGWEEATAGVDSISFYNSGGLGWDIATAMNIATFEELTGIQVNAIAVSADLAEPKSLATLVAKDTSVDAVIANDPAYNLSALAAGGWLTVVDNMYPPEVLELYNPEIVSSYTWDGHWYALPVTYIGHVDFYRPSWLDGAGIDVPETYVEFGEAVRAVGDWARSEGGDSAYGAVYVGGTQDAINFYRTLMYSQGKKVLENGEYQFGSAESRRAFGLMVDLAKEGYVPSDHLSYAWGDVGRFFGMGNAGFMNAIQPSYLTVYQRGDFPAVEGDVEVFAPLKWDASSPDTNAGGGVIGSNSMLINDEIDDAQKAAVMLFADYVRSRQGQRNEVIVEGNESGLLYLWENMDAELQLVDWDLAETVAAELNIDAPARKTTLPAFEVRRINSTKAVFEVYYPGFQKIAQKFLEEYSNAVLGQTSIEEAIEAIQNLADELS